MRYVTHKICHDCGHDTHGNTFIVHGFVVHHPGVIVEDLRGHIHVYSKQCLNWEMEDE